MSWWHRGFTCPDHLWLKRKRKWNWLVDFAYLSHSPCIRVYKGDMCVHWLDFCFGAEWMRRVLISTKPFIFVLFLVGVSVRSAESLSSAIPLGTSTKRANSKRANHGRSHLFQDAVSSVSFWLRSFPVCGWWTRSLSSVSGLPTPRRCIRGWLMRLLWAYEHDFVAISPFLYERIGTLCRHPCWSLCKQRIAGWRSGRSEGDSKSLSAGYVPTDLLLLKQRTSRPVPRWFRWSVPRGAQHFIRCAVCR